MCHKVPQFSQIDSTYGSFKGFRPFLGKKPTFSALCLKCTFLTDSWAKFIAHSVKYQSLIVYYKMSVSIWAIVFWNWSRFDITFIASRIVLSKIHNSEAQWRSIYQLGYYGSETRLIVV